MKSDSLESIARKSMGVTPGVWTAQGGVILCDGVPMFTVLPGVLEWQAEANSDTLASLMNNRSEIIFALEKFPLLHSALQQANATNYQLRLELEAAQSIALSNAA